jgi:hypothetical protein
MSATITLLLSEYSGLHVQIKRLRDHADAMSADRDGFYKIAEDRKARAEAEWTSQNASSITVERVS